MNTAMKIQIHPNACANYIARCYRHNRHSQNMLHNAAFADKLRKVQGQWLDVDTTHLFADQFNTLPIEGVTENGLRVMQSDIVAIANDVRNNVLSVNGATVMTQIMTESATNAAKMTIYRP